MDGAQRKIISEKSAHFLRTCFSQLFFFFWAFMPARFLFFFSHLSFFFFGSLAFLLFASNSCGPYDLLRKQ